MLKWQLRVLKTTTKTSYLAYINDKTWLRRNIASINVPKTLNLSIDKDTVFRCTILLMF